MTAYKSLPVHLILKTPPEVSIGIPRLPWRQRGSSVWGLLRGGDIRSPPLRLWVDSQPAIQAASAGLLLVSVTVDKNPVVELVTLSWP